MGLPTITQAWTTSFNNRTTFASLVATVGAVMYSWTQFLITTMGYTCKGSNSTSGGAMDGVNRITSASAWATRVNGAGALSWIVLTDAQGIDWCWSYNASSDDIVRLAHSQGGNYVAAGTPTNQPTATDEAFDAASGSWVNATTSLDRVWHMWGSADKKMFRIIIARQGTIASYIAGEKFVSAMVSPCTPVLSTGGGVNVAVKSFYTLALNAVGAFAANGVGSATWVYSATTISDLCKVHANGGDNLATVANGGECVGGSSGQSMTVEKPRLQGGIGEILFPFNMGAANAFAIDGKLGNKIDAWYALGGSGGAGTSPIIGDNFGNHYLESVSNGFGGLILPGDGVTQLVYV